MTATIHYLHERRNPRHVWPEFKLAYIVHWLDRGGNERFTKVRGVNSPAQARIKLAAAKEEFEDFLSPVQVVRDDR